MPATSNDIIFGYNRLWYQMYADALYESPEYHITVTPECPVSYYNAAHGLSDVSTTKLREIETIFARHHVAPGLYLMEEEAAPAGYNAIENDTENWWVKSLTPIENTSVSLPEGFSIRQVDLDVAGELESFLAVDAIANDLDKVLVRSLMDHIMERREYENALFLGFYHGIPCACGSVGFVGDVAYLAEGGVLPEYRGRGFHTALTLHRIAYAAPLAKRVVMVSSISSGSNATAQSLGFERLFSRYFFQKRMAGS